MDRKNHIAKPRMCYESREYSQIKNVTKVPILNHCKNAYFSAFVNQCQCCDNTVVSGFPGPMKAWRKKNFSGLYSFEEEVNERPVYKVRFLISIHSCDNRILSFLFSAKPEN